MKNQTELSKLQKIINGLFFIIFTLFAALQVNDPDPIIWFSIYMIVGLISLFSFFWIIPRVLIWVLIIVFLIYAMYLFPSFIEWLQSKNDNNIFSKLIDEKPNSEETKEFLGLLIAIGGLAFQLRKSTTES